MDISLLAVADYANSGIDGKLNLIGVFNTVHAQTYPFAHEELYLIVQVTATSNEYGKPFSMDIQLVDEDGLELLKINAEGVVPAGEKGKTITLNHILKLVKVIFPKPGSYEFSIYINGQLNMSLPISAATNSLRAS